LKMIMLFSAAENNPRMNCFICRTGCEFRKWAMTS